jgi:hypothetical protein
MRNNLKKVSTLICVVLLPLYGSIHTCAQARKTSYSVMAPLGQYVMEEGTEIALAQSAAPASISGDAEVMVLRRDGYVTAVKGKNGFVCIVERAWGRPPTTRNSGTRKCVPLIASTRKQQGRSCRFI